MAALVLDACERNGGGALLPGSDGEDSSAVPDNTPAVCGCWANWVATNLTENQIETLIADDGNAEGALSLSSQLSGLTSSLGACDQGQTPASSSGTTGSSGSTGNGNGASGYSGASTGDSGGTCSSDAIASSGVTIPPPRLRATICAAANLPDVSARDEKNVAYVSAANPDYAVVFYNPAVAVPSQYAQGYDVLLHKVSGTWEPLTNVTQACVDPDPSVPSAVESALCKAYEPVVGPRSVGATRSADGTVGTNVTGSQAGSGSTGCGTVAFDGIQSDVTASGLPCASALQAASSYASNANSSSSGFDYDDNDYFLLGQRLCVDGSYGVSCGTNHSHFWLANPGKRPPALPLAGATIGEHVCTTAFLSGIVGNGDVVTLPTPTTEGTNVGYYVMASGMSCSAAASVMAHFLGSSSMQDFASGSATVSETINGARCTSGPGNLVAGGSGARATVAVYGTCISSNGAEAAAG